jgi:hypothetical protein
MRGLPFFFITLALERVAAISGAQDIRSSNAVPLPSFSFPFVEERTMVPAGSLRPACSM